MNVTAQKFQSQYALVCKPSARSNQRTTLPQSRPFGRASSLREGAGRGLHHSSGYSLKSGVTGDFHRPYETQKILAFAIQRTTLPQSRPLGVPAPSKREPGGVRTIHRTTQKPQRFGRFSSPLRKRYNLLWSHPLPKKIEKSGWGWYNQEGSIKKIQRGNVHVLY